MLVASILLAVIAGLGAFDVFYFHRGHARITERPDARREAWIHVARGVIYTLQLALIPNVRFAGAWYLALVALLIVDVAIAVADVCCEPEARRSVGGLSAGEYLAHIALSVLVGAYLQSLITTTTAWASQATALTWSPGAPAPLRVLLAILAAGCLACTIDDVLKLLGAARPRPLHVAVRLRCSIDELWAITQDHVRHPRWDHRFSRIVMLADEIRTGTEMRYEKRVLGMTIRGSGRYKLHRPLQQSTFEFWSDDPRSLIRRGVGLWRYLPGPDGTAELRTSYTYDVRWGALGRVIDRLIFRPLMQRETERSFARLRRDWFGDRGSAVAGRIGGKPAPVQGFG